MYCRNTTDFQDDVALFEPLKPQALTAQEMYALKSICRVDDNIVECSDRAVVLGDIYHSLMYRRSGTSCSSIVRVHDKCRKMEFHGTVLKFVAIHGRGIALIWRFDCHGDINICKHGRTQPDIPLIRRFVQDGIVGKDFIAVSDVDDVVAVFCNYIVDKCIFIKSDQIPDIKGFLTPVMRDYFC